MMSRAAMEEAYKTRPNRILDVLVRRQQFTGRMLGIGARELLLAGISCASPQRLPSKSVA